MLFYIKNVLSDIIFGYIEVKCCNKMCNSKFKIARNNINVNGIDNYSCNMGCAIEAYNQSKSLNTKE
jgi:hypothetical protein